MKGKGGFTLLELMIVVIILAILAAVAIPRYMVAQDRARATEAIQQIGVISDELRAYKQLNPTTNVTGLDFLGYNSTTFIPAGGTFNYTCTNTSIIATKTSAVGGQAVGQTLSCGVDNATWYGNLSGGPKGTIQ